MLLLSPDNDRNKAPGWPRGRCVNGIAGLVARPLRLCWYVAIVAAQRIGAVLVTLGNGAATVCILIRRWCTGDTRSCSTLRT